MTSGLLNSDAAVQFQMTMAELKDGASTKFRSWEREFERREKESQERVRKGAGGWNHFMSELQEYDDAEEKRMIGGGMVLGEVEDLDMDM